MAASDNSSNSSSVPRFSADDVGIATLRAAIAGGFSIPSGDIVGLKSELTAAKRKAPDGEQAGRTEATESLSPASDEDLANVWRERAVNTDWREAVEKVSERVGAC